MKKVILIVFLAFGFSKTSNAQIDFGIKAGVNYNNSDNDSFKTIGDDVINGAKSKSGYHAGIWLRGNITDSFYIRPELVYTKVKNEYVYQTINTDYEFQKIDVPVLVGVKFLSFANAFIGPSFQYIIEEDFKFSDATTDEFDKFSLGLQMGVGIELGNLGIDVRWERGLSTSEAKFANNFTVDNRTNQIIFGLSFKL